MSLSDAADAAERHRLNFEDIDRAKGFAWFAATVKPNRFAQAKLNLQNQNFKTFMPLLERTVRYARVEQQVLRPAFPGYIFVGFDRDTTQWRVINNTFGVSGLVMSAANSPLPVHADLMASMMARCDSVGKVLPPAAFAAGDKVRVLSGPFKDLLAEVAKTSDGDRVRLLLDLMGRAVSTGCVEVDVATGLSK